MEQYLINYQNLDLWILLGRTYHSIAQLREKECRQYGLPSCQAYILFVIKALGEKATPTQISRVSYRKASTITGILNRMVENGLVIKINNTSGKGYLTVRLTEKGKKAYTQSMHRDYLEKVMSALTEEKRQQLKSCLEILLNNALNEHAFNCEKPVSPSQLVLKNHRK